MAKVVIILVGFLLLIFGYFLSHLYIVNFLNRHLALNNYKNLVKFIFVLMFSVSFLSLILRAVVVPDAVLKTIYFFGFYWMGIVIIFVSYCVIGDFISFLFLKGSNKYIGLGVLLVSLISSTLATYRGIKMSKIKQIVVDLDGNNSFRIVYLSDLHLDFKYKNKIAIELFNKIKNIDPQILIFGGDMFDPGFVYDVKLEETIKKIYSTKIAVLGNHDYYFGIEKSKRIFEQFGFIVLQNTSFEIENVNIIGLGDIRTENLHKEEIVSIINNNYKTGKLNIVVSHQPLFFDELSKNFDIMMLSGHTHNGQIFPFHIFTRIFYKYLYGLFRKNKSTLYVTSGAGVWGPPMRFLSSSEVVVIDIL